MKERNVLSAQSASCIDEFVTEGRQTWCMARVIGDD